MAGRAQAQAPSFLYATGGDGVSGFAVDAAGTLTSLGGFPVAGGSEGVRPAITPSGRFIYVANQNDKTISAYSIDALNGGLTAVAGSPFKAGQYPASMVVHPNGKFLYVANYLSTGAASISVFQIDAATGALTSPATFAGQFGTLSLSVTPDGSYLYAGSYVGGTGLSKITAYQIDAATGALTVVPGSPFTTFAFLYDVVMHPSGKFVFVVFNAGVVTFTIDPATGSLTQTGTAFNGVIMVAGSIVSQADGDYFYAADYSGSRVYGYSIDGTNGLLTALADSPWSLPQSTPWSMVGDSARHRVFTGFRFSPNVAEFSVGAGGALTATAGSPFAGPAIAAGLAMVTPALAPGATLTSLQIQPANLVVSSNVLQKKITYLAVGTFSDGSQHFVTSSATWQSSDTLVATIGDAAGHKGEAITTGFGTTTLTATIGGVSATTTLTTVAPPVISMHVSPGDSLISRGASQQFTATATYQDGSSEIVSSVATWASDVPGVASVSPDGFAQALARGRTTISATLGGVTGTAGLSVDTTGSFLYLAQPEDHHVSGYRIQDDGSLAAIAGSPFGAGMNLASLAIHPNHKFLYGSDTFGNAIRAFSIDANTGGLAPLAASPFAVGNSPIGLAVHPGGRFLFSTAGTTAVRIFAIDPDSGELTPGATVPTGGTFAQAIAVHPTGSFVFVSNNGTSTVSVFQFDEVAGTLTPIAGSPFAVRTNALPIALNVNPAGTHLFVSSNQSGQVLTYAIGSNGSLEELSAASVGLAYGPLAIHPAGKLAFFAGNDGAHAFALSSSSGALTEVTGSPYLGGYTTPMQYVQLDPAGRYAYYSVWYQGTLHGFAINQSTGTLRSVPASPFAVPGAIAAMASTGAPLPSPSATLVSLEITPANATFLHPLLNRPFSFDAIGTYSDGAKQYLTAVVNWQSSATGVATISNAIGSSGVATTTGFGTTTISASIGGVSASTSFTVQKAALTSLTVLPGASSLPAGATQQYEAWGRYEEGTLLDLTASATWSSSNAAVASIGAGGLASALASGHTTIAAATDGSIASVPLHVTNAGGFAYVTNEGSANLSAYAIDGTTGALTQVPGSPFATGSTPEFAAIHPNGSFLYVANKGSDNISAYSLDAVNGAPVPVAGSPFAAGTAPNSIAFTPNGQYLYAVNYLGSNVSAYQVDAATGVLTPIAGSPFAGAFGMITGAVDPTGHYLYVGKYVGGASGDHSEVILFRINQATGALTKDAALPALTPRSVASLAMDPVGRYLYAVHAEGVSGFAIDAATGELTQIGAWPAGNLSQAGAVDSRGHFLYVANYSSSTISTFAIAQATGQLTPLGSSPFTSGSSPFGIALAPTGRLALVADRFGGDVSRHLIDPATGEPGDAASTPAGTNPSSVAIAPLGIAPGTTLTALQIAPNPAVIRTNLPGKTLQLTAIGIYDDGSSHPITASVTWSSSDTTVATISDAAGTKGIATSVNFGDTTITASLGGVSTTTTLTVSLAMLSMQITPSDSTIGTGATLQLRAIARNFDGTSDDVSAGVTWQIAEPRVADLSAAGLVTARTNGRTSITAALYSFTATAWVSVGAPASFLYVSHSSTNQVGAYVIHGDGSLTPGTGSPFAAGNSPAGVAVHPNRRLLYVVNEFSSNLSAYTIAPGTGALTPVPGSPYPAGSAPYRVGIHPSGDFLYVTNTSSSSLTGYRIDQATGALALIPGSPFASSAFPRDVVVEPSGRFAYVASGSGMVDAFSVDTATGALTRLPASSYNLGSNPISIVVNDAGTLLWVGRNNSGNISTLSINSVTGAVTPTSAAPEYAGLAWDRLQLGSSGASAFYSGTAGAMSFTINPSNGDLTPVAGSPFKPNVQFQYAAVDPTNSYAFMAPWYASVVHGFRIKPDLSLKDLPGSPFALAGNVGQMQATSGPSTSPTATLASIEVTPAITTMLAPQAGRTIAFDVVGTYSDGTQQYLTAGATWTSSDTNVATIGNGIGTVGVATTTGFGQSTITATFGGFTATATLTSQQAAVTALAILPGSSTVAVGDTVQYHATARYEEGTVLDVTNAASWSSSNTSVAPITAGGSSTATAIGRTTITATFGAASADAPLFVSNTLGSAFVANNTGGVFAYSVGTATGSLTPTGGSPFNAGTQPLFVAVHPNGKLVYVTNATSNDISAFNVDPISGTLALVAGSPFKTLNQPASIAFTPDGSLLYVAETLSHTVSVYAVNQSTGALTATGAHFTTAFAPLSIAVNPSGTFLLVGSYIGGTSSSHLSVYQINGATGALTLVGEPFDLPYFLTGIAIHPSGNYVYASTLNGVSALALNGAGTLTLVGSQGAGSTPQAIAVDPLGRFVFVANYSSHNVSVYSIDAASGNVSPVAGSPFTGVTFPRYAATDSLGRYLYVTGSAAGQSFGVSMYAVDQSTGALSVIAGSPVAAGGAPMGIALGPLTLSPTATITNLDIVPAQTTIASLLFGKTAQFRAVATYSDGSSHYVTDSATWASLDPGVATVGNAAGVKGLATTTGFGTASITATLGGITATAQLLVTQPTITRVRVLPVSVTVLPGATQAFHVSATYEDGRSEDVTSVATWQSNATAVATVDAAGIATAVALGNAAITASAGGASASAAMSVTAGDGYAFAVNQYSNDISAFRINPITGDLTQVPGSPFQSGANFAVDLVATPDARFLYVPGGFFNTVSGFKVNGATGALTPVQGSPFAAGSMPTYAAVSPSGEFLFVTNDTSNNISVYRIDAVTGSLTQIAGSPFSTRAFPRHVAVDPSGEHLYVANRGPNVISAYRIDQATGALSEIAGSPFAVWRFPWNGNGSPIGLAFDPAGRNLYISTNDHGTIERFKVDPATGAIEDLAMTSISLAIAPIGIDRTGRYAYHAGTTGPDGFLIDQTTGDLTRIAGSPFASQQLFSVTTDFTGRFAYFPEWYSGNIHGFRIDQATGILLGISGSPFVAGNTATKVVTLPKRLRATIQLSGLAQNYDGSPKSAIATTDPFGLAVTMTYDGSPIAPTNAGSYDVVATLTEAGYEPAGATGTLFIEKGGQTITFDALADKTYGDAPFAVSATASSLLEVSFAASGACSLAGHTVTITGVGNCTITASQDGNDNYKAATPVEQSFNIAPATTLSISSSVAYAALTAPAASASGLYTINLATGAATLVGTIGGGTTIRSVNVDPASGSILALATAGNKIVTVSPWSPSIVRAAINVTGLQPGETLREISFRPVNGVLYGLGSSSRLYTINTSTGIATQVGAGQFSPALSGTEFGFDFNPVPDRIRIVSNTGQNLRINPDTGAIAAVDPNLNGAAAQAVGVGYTNSFAGALTTTLYDIDALSDSLYIQNPPNNGTLTLVGALGFDTSDLAGFDISNPLVLPNAQAGSSYSVKLNGIGGAAPYTFSTISTLPAGLTLGADGTISGTTLATGVFPIVVTVTDPNGSTGTQTYNLTVNSLPVSLSTSTAFAALTAPAAAESGFYQVDLATGHATLVGMIGGGATVRGISFQLNTDTVFAVTSSNTLISFNRNSPSAVTTVGAISGAAGNIVGIDFRPATGQLYAVSSASMIYVINTATAVATQVGSGAFSPALSGSSFGVNFNPVVDRIRVVSNTGQNLRLNPDLGAVAATDPSLNGGATQAVGAAYSNNFAGATVTTLYDIDPVSDSLYIQNPPNNGTLNLVGSLGFDTNDAVGFDISNSVLPNGTAGALYSQTILGVGGTAPYSFALTSGATPPGLSLSSSGLLSGTPTTSGNFTFSVLATDVNGASGGQTYTVDIECATITLSPGVLPDGIVGAPYGRTISASGGTGPYTFDLTAGSLPSGLTLSSGGVISGTPQVANTATFTVRATDANGCSGSLSYTLTVIDSPVSLSTSTAFAALTAPAAAESGFYQVDLATGHATLVGMIGGGETVRAISFQLNTDTVFAVTSNNTLISFDRHAPGASTTVGAISGAAGNIVGIDFRPATGQLYGLSSDSIIYVIDTTTAAATQVGSGSFAPALSGTAFGVNFNPVVDRIRVVSNSGQNLRLNPDTGVAAATDPNLNGDATQAAGVAYRNNFAGATVTTLYDIDAVSDSLYIQNPPNNGTLSLVGSLGFDTTDSVGFDISNSVLPDGTAGELYNQTILGAGGTAPYSFVLASGAPPPGLSLSATGLVSGTPTTTGSFTFSVQATDVNGASGSQTYTVEIGCGAITLLPGTLPDGDAGVAYSQTFTASPAGTYTWALSSGALPDGLSLNSSSGVLSGTPGTPGLFSFIIRATDGNSCSGSLSYAVAIHCANIELSPPTLPDGNAGDPYSQTITASGGTGPYTFELIAGSLPSGLTLSSGGVISGTPDSAGTATFTVRATDANGCSKSVTYTVSIVLQCPTITISPSTIPNGTAGVAYSQTFTASGGTGPYTFIVASGSLPTGLTLSSAGVLSGTPPSAGVFSFTIVATDPRSCASSPTRYTVTVAPNRPPRITNFTPTSGLPGTQVTITGSNFTTVSAVKFGPVIAQFTYVSDSQIIAVVPATARTSHISVTTSHGTGTTGANKFIVIKRPTISSFTPATGPVGTVVVMHGTHFEGTTEVNFDGAGAGVPTIISAHKISVMVPAGARTGTITVRNPAGDGISVGIFKVTPKITSFSPASGVAGESVSISGFNLKVGSTPPTVKIGAIVLPVSSSTATMVVVTIPATAITGKVMVTTADGTAISADDFIVIKPPTITSFTPAAGKVGSSVMIHGTNLASATDVRFNGTSVTSGITVVTATSIRVSVPAGATTGKIKVTNAAGQATSVGTFTVIP